MTRRRRSVAFFIIVTSIAVTACGSGQAPRWSGESKNSDEQLSSAQRNVLRRKLERLQQSMPALAPAARSLALLVDGGERGETPQRRQAAAVLAERFEALLERDRDLRSLTFLSDDFLRLVTVSRTSGAQFDFENAEPNLREQIGFFPEDLHTRIEDPHGYPQPQYSVAVRGRTAIRIRVPLTANGFYFGDLIAEYGPD